MSLSYALDITEGQPAGHCVRACWIGMHIGRDAGMEAEQLWELYYTLLLKDLGCSSNAARICELYLTDDLDFKRDFKTVGDSLPQVLGFVLKHTGLKAGLAERFRSVMTILRDGPAIAQEMIATRCSRGAEIARMLRFPERVANGIYSLDEHFNGKGKPAKLAGEAIPVYSRIALLAQVVDVFHAEGGRAAALKEARARAGSWFDPRLVAALERVGKQDAFWDMLASPEIDKTRVRHGAGRAHDRARRRLSRRHRRRLRPGGRFEKPVHEWPQQPRGAVHRHDRRSPGLAGRAAPLAQARRAAARRRQAGRLEQRPRQSRRARPRRMGGGARSMPHYTETILGRIAAFAELGRIAGAHHERLDGGGYPRGLSGDQIDIETRIITTADIFDAITAERPYRGAIPVPQALEMMEKTVGTALDARCFDALKRALERVPNMAP